MGNVETAKESYEAFGRGDLQALKFADDVVWWTSDELPLGGEVTGREAVLQNFSQIPNYWSDFSVTPERFIDAGDTVVVTGTQKATGKGGSFAAPFVHILEYRDGLASRGEFYGDTVKALKALGD
ncbi:MAG: nuclear transport factor 2 family protein [Actinomycetota bacterium]|nr:nuclear transport factor 2 family protein [Actinomycetota bacterium]